MVRINEIYPMWWEHEMKLRQTALRYFWCTKEFSWEWWWNCQGHSYSNYPVLFQMMSRDFIRPMARPMARFLASHDPQLETFHRWNMAGKCFHRWFSPSSKLHGVPGSLACRGCYQQFFSRTMSCWSMQHRWPWSKQWRKNMEGTYCRYPQT